MPGKIVGDRQVQLDVLGGPVGKEEVQEALVPPVERTHLGTIGIRIRIIIIIIINNIIIIGIIIMIFKILKVIMIEIISKIIIVIIILINMICEMPRQAAEVP